jgi:hypothetical protein
MYYIFLCEKTSADLSDFMDAMLKCNYAVLVDCFNHTLMSDKYIWDDKSPELFVEALNSPSIQSMVHNFKGHMTQKIIFSILFDLVIK